MYFFPEKKYALFLAEQKPIILYSDTENQRTTCSIFMYLETLNKYSISSGLLHLDM